MFGAALGGGQATELQRRRCERARDAQAFNRENHRRVEEMQREFERDRRRAALNDCIAQVPKGCRTACADGRGSACGLLGFMYLKGELLPKNRELATRSFELGCRKGDPASCSSARSMIADPQWGEVAPIADVRSRESVAVPRGAEDVVLLLFGGADHKTFLGCINCDKSSNISIFNESGEFGRFSEKSLWNKFADFGSQFSDVSPWNKWASHPPVVADKEGRYYGHFTASTTDSDRCRLDVVNAIIEAHERSK